MHGPPLTTAAPQFNVGSANAACKFLWGQPDLGVCDTDATYKVGRLSSSESAGALAEDAWPQGAWTLPQIWTPWTSPEVVLPCLGPPDLRITPPGLGSPLSASDTLSPSGDVRFACVPQPGPVIAGGCPRLHRGAVDRKIYFLDSNISASRCRANCLGRCVIWTREPGGADAPGPIGHRVRL